MVVTGLAVAQWPSSEANQSNPSDPVAQSLPLYDSPLGLQVSPRSHQLVIQWSRNSAAVLSANNGTVRITDGKTNQVAELSREQLKDGYIAYLPTTRDVSVEVQVKARNGSTTTESVRFLGLIN